MLPVTWFLVLIAAWATWRIAVWLERALVAKRSTGWRLLLVIGGLAYAVPAAMGGTWLVLPVVALTVDAGFRLVPWPARRPMPMPTSEPMLAIGDDVGGAEVIPIR